MSDEEKERLFRRVLDIRTVQRRHDAECEKDEGCRLCAIVAFALIIARRNFAKVTQ